MKDFMKHNEGFSLVEIIIAVAIMAILTGVVAPSMIRYAEKSRETKALTEAGHLKDAITYEAVDKASIGVLGITGLGATINAGSNYPSIYSIVESMGKDGFGNPSADGCYTNGVVYASCGNIAAGAHQSGTVRHFKCVMTNVGELIKLQYCNGEFIVDYTVQSGFSVSKNTGGCPAALYNYICIGDNGESVYPSIDLFN